MFLARFNLVIAGRRKLEVARFRFDLGASKIYILMGLPTNLHPFESCEQCGKPTVSVCSTIASKAAVDARAQTVFSYTIFKIA